MEDLIKSLSIDNILIFSFVSWGITEAVKPVVKQYLPKPIYTFILRTLAIAAGAASGLVFGDTLKDVGLGAACGAMSAFTVALVKRLVSSKAKVDLKEIEGGVSKEGDEKSE